MLPAMSMVAWPLHRQDLARGNQRNESVRADGRFRRRPAAPTSPDPGCPARRQVAAHPQAGTASPAVDGRTPPAPAHRWSPGPPAESPGTLAPPPQDHLLELGVWI